MLTLKSKYSENGGGMPLKNVSPVHYKKLLKIDQNDLDTDLSRHATIFGEVADNYVEAKDRRDGLKNEIEELRDTLSLAIRKKYRAKKITNEEVNARVRSNSAFRRLNIQYLEASNDAERWFNLKEAFHARGYMLRELCGLFSSSYWSRTSVKGEADKVDVRRMREGMRSKRF